MVRQEALALIPARGGSKSVPRKNLQRLAGHPLVAHSIAAAKASRTVTRIVVSTDDAEVEAVARQYGAEVPFRRPAHLAQDETPDLPAFEHALQWLHEHEGYRPELIVHLRPTSPLRRPEHIDAAVDLLRAHAEADAVRTVVVPLQNPFKMWKIAGDGYLEPLLHASKPEPYNMPRQLLPLVLWQTGYVDVTRWRTIMELHSMTGTRILPLVHDSAEWVDIDTTTGFEHAEFLLRSGRVRPVLPPGEPLMDLDVGCVVLDFDGVLTDNRVWVSEAGAEAVAFDRSDGMGLARLRQAGVDVLVLSSEVNQVVAARCRKLGLSYQQGVADKRKALEDWAASRGIDLRRAMYVGNDVNDLDGMDTVGVAVAVADAHPMVRARADVILTRPGGRGAVRELCDWILSAQRTGARGGQRS